MPELELATDPLKSYSVVASAGTGKTWQLIARLTRLLLRGTPLDSILAITFTRKAAGEMQQRMTERLLELLEADDDTLDQLLSSIGETATTELRIKARSLLEQWLRSPRPLRTLTFHSFCQELLQRFPLEAGLPPGFELIEQTGLLLQESWDALFSNVSQSPDTAEAEALETLFELMGSLYSTQQVLYEFVHHRSDWWAYHHGNEQPVAYAIGLLEETLTLNPDVSFEAFWNDISREKLLSFSSLLEKHATAKNTGYVESIQDLLKNSNNPETTLQELLRIFFTAKRTRLKRKESNIQKKKMGDNGEKSFLNLHDWFCEQIEAILEQQARQHTLNLNRAWYIAGNALLENFQRIKRERRQLDFADLEWHTYLLLHQSDQHHWIQFKLDQRVDHLLIDEFQDTNPTQWRLILPLLEEMAAGDGERTRSLFIVGDPKQSIYRFRRGNPRLLGHADEWMRHNLNAQRVELNDSWRSSSVVLDFVNKVYDSESMRALLDSYTTHSTHRKNLWGQVEIWPLVENISENVTTESNQPGNELRNPLEQPRPEAVDQRHYHEGLEIAKKIEQLIDQKMLVDEGDKAHAIHYSDVLILLRTRSHLGEYEAALRDHNIPYLSLNRGTLLKNIEIRDLQALLRILVSPQDNLTLAQVLRCPIFSVTNNDLIALAKQGDGAWLERLSKLSETLDASHLLHRAYRLLSSWQTLAGHIPIHDLLERIFHESNLVARYRAAVPKSQADRVQANLAQFIELALEVDSGRYPTLSRFLERVSQLRALDKEGPSEIAPDGNTTGRVRILTVHGAKGLESSVVFLADTCTANKGPGGFKTLIRWPAEQDRPSDFQLLSKKELRDSISTQRDELEQIEDERESANLLYVALTRAKQLLIISGCQPARGSITGWYKQITAATLEQAPSSEPWIQNSGEAKYSTAPANENVIADYPIDPRFHQIITLNDIEASRAPSHQQEDSSQQFDEWERIRGLAIHRFLQLSCEQQNVGLQKRIANEFQQDQNDPLLNEWCEEAESLLTKNELQWIFTPESGTECFNEISIEYREKGKTVSGIIDRLLKTPDGVQIIDYKTHRIDEEAQLPALLEQHRAQLQSYKIGVEKLWPGTLVSCYLLFTHHGHLIEL